VSRVDSDSLAIGLQRYREVTQRSCIPPNCEVEVHQPVVDGYRLAVGLNRARVIPLVLQHISAIAQHIDVGRIEFQGCGNRLVGGEPLPVIDIGLRQIGVCLGQRWRELNRLLTVGHGLPGHPEPIVGQAEESPGPPILGLTCECLSGHLKSALCLTVVDQQTRQLQIELGLVRIQIQGPLVACNGSTDRSFPVGLFC